MKKILILIGAFIGVGLLGFIFGFASQAGKVGAARTEAAACRTETETAARSASANIGLLELYRARAELGRSNYGSAGDAMNRAKSLLAGDAYADARGAIDKTTALVLKQEAASADEIGAIIKSLEATGLPAAPQGAPAAIAPAKAPADEPAHKTE